MHPDVSLSSRLTAIDQGMVRILASMNEPTLTVYLGETEIVDEDLNETVLVISASGVHRLLVPADHIRHTKARVLCGCNTHYTSRLIDDNDLTFFITKQDFHWCRSDGWLMAVDKIPTSESISSWPAVLIFKYATYSILSPLRTMVPGRATLPLTVTTPDSRAYLWTLAVS